MTKMSPSTWYLPAYNQMPKGTIREIYFYQNYDTFSLILNNKCVFSEPWETLNYVFEQMP